MKKNLRIVSAAAAALLAVAPVAATVAPAASTVSAAVSSVKPNENLVATKNISATYRGNAYTIKKGDKLVVIKTSAHNGSVVKVNSKYTVTIANTADLLGGVNAATAAKPSTPAVNDNGATSSNAGASSIFRADANTAVNLTAVAKTNVAPSTLTGNIVATLDGKQVTATLHNSVDSNNVHVYTYRKGERVNANKMTAGHYWAAFENVTVNAGASYAGKTETFTLNKGTFSSISVTTPGATNEGASLTRTADSNGVFHLGPVLVDFYAYNANDLKEVHFYDATTGNVVTSGNVTLHAVNGQLTAQAVYAALNAKYGASQFRGGLDNDPDVLKPVNDIKDQLKAQNVTVDPNGYFKAPASFSINITHRSATCGAESRPCPCAPMSG